MTNQCDLTPQFDLTGDQREIQELARRFTADRITPHAAECLKNTNQADGWLAEQRRSRA